MVSDVRSLDVIQTSFFFYIDAPTTSPCVWRANHWQCSVHIRRLRVDSDQRHCDGSIALPLHPVTQQVIAVSFSSVSIVSQLSHRHVENRMEVISMLKCIAWGWRCPVFPHKTYPLVYMFTLLPSSFWLPLSDATFSTLVHIAKPLAETCLTSICFLARSYMRTHQSHLCVLTMKYEATSRVYFSCPEVKKRCLLAPLKLTV